MVEYKAPVRTFKLHAESELRFEVEKKDEKVTLVLKDGLAEVFGAELVKGKKYQFRRGAKVAVYTWQGCTLELVGKTESTYTSNETPMTVYLNCHVALETMRESADKADSRGPITMIMGPYDVGKSTVCRLLINYAIRMGRRPIYVDLNVEKGHIAIPGTMGAQLIDRICDVVDGLSPQEPLVFHFGHTNPTSNEDLFKILVSRLADLCSEKLQTHKKIKVSGIVINTCGWIQGSGYKLLTYAAEAFEVDTVFVMGQEKLYNELIREMPQFVKVLHLPRSGGVVERNAAQRTEARDQCIREYFYGSRTPLYPHSFEVKWSGAKIFKIGAPPLPPSCIPMGIRTNDHLTKLVPVILGPNLLNHILAVSFANSSNDDAVQTNVVGFVCVTSVDVERETLTVLSPQPGPLPNHILLLSEVQFTDAQ